jgi:hypothetical protein
MGPFRIALAIAICAFSAPSPAQDVSLEQSYASMCAGKPAPETEACAALRQALASKLSRTPDASPLVEKATRAISPEEMRRRWGYNADLVGKRYFSSDVANIITTISWEVYGEVMKTSSITATKYGEPKHEACCPEVVMKTRWDPARNVLVDEATGNVGTATQPAADGSYIGPVVSIPSFGNTRSRVWINADGSWVAVAERLRGEKWKEFDRTTFREMTPQFMAQLRGSDSRGDSGLIGALAMGVGAALAGGNAEQVMGMAMKGAELTTDNEMSRNVLAGQGDAMVAAGTQRMAAENQSVAGSSGSVSAAGADTRAGVAMPAGSPATAPAAKSATVSTTAYLIVGMRPTEKNTRNPMCYSTPFQISYQSEENHWGDSGRAEAAAMAYRGQFEAACSRHGQVDGITSPHIQSINGGSASASATNEDFVVPIP